MSRNTVPVLLWYRRDLRLDDHAALNAAHASGQPIVPRFILDDETPGNGFQEVPVAGGSITACRRWTLRYKNGVDI